MNSTTVVTDTPASTAAYVMYEQGLRLGREAPGLKSLQKQVWTMLVCMLRKLVCWEGGRGGGKGGRLHYDMNCNYLTLPEVYISWCLFVVCSFVVYLLFVHLLFVCCLSICLQANCYSMALTALNLTDPKYAWVIRPVEVEEVCVGGSSCMTREGGSCSGTSLGDHCCVFATREVRSSNIFLVGMAMCTGAMRLCYQSLSCCVCM